MSGVTFSVRLDRRTLKALEQLARAEERSKADTLRRMILGQARQLKAEKEVQPSETASAL